MWQNLGAAWEPATIDVCVIEYCGTQHWFLPNKETESTKNKCNKFTVLSCSVSRWQVCPPDALNVASFPGRVGSLGTSQCKHDCVVLGGQL